MRSLSIEFLLKTRLPTVLAGLLLASCGDSTPTTVTTHGSTVVVAGADRKIVTAGEGESLELTASLPAFAPAYPGASVKTQLSGIESEDSGKGQLVVFNTSDPVAKVAAFYDAQAKENGAKAAMVVNEADSAVRIFGGESRDEKAGALIAISKSEDGSGTDIVITSGAAETTVKKWKAKDWSGPPPRLQ